MPPTSPDNFDLLYQAPGGFLGGAVVKNVPANAGEARDAGLVPRQGRWQPIPVFLPGKIPGTEESGGLYSPWGCKELDMTEHVGNALGPRVTSEHLFCVKFQVAFGGPRKQRRRGSDSQVTHCHELKQDIWEAGQWSGLSSRNTRLAFNSQLCEIAETT